MTASLQRLAPKKRGAGGFSLIELLIVVTLLLILSAMMGGHYGTTTRKRELANCQKNLQKIYLALSIYQNDSKGSYPFLTGAENPAAPLSLLVPKSSTVTEIFICPGSDDKPLPEGESFASRKISYAYYMGRTVNDDPNEILLSDAQVDIAPKNKGQQIFSRDGKKPGNNHGKYGGNLLSRGGEVTTTDPTADRDVRYPPSVHLLNPQ